jgi:hypothetical protein
MTNNAAPPPRAWPPAAAPLAALAPGAPLTQLNLAMPWPSPQHTASVDKLSLASSMGKLSLAPAAPALSQWGQPWAQAAPWPQACGQGCGLACGQAYGQTYGQQLGHAFGAWPPATGAPAVDMLVLPSNDSCAVQDSKNDVVKVAYTSAEDLADALFPTSVAASSDLNSQLARHDADIDKLSDHRELVHEALLDHRDKVNQLHESVGLVDEGLLDHRKHIKQLRSQSSSALKRIDAHDQALSRLQQDVKSLSRLQHDVKTLSDTTKSMDKGLKTHATCLELQNKGLQSLSTSHDTLASAQSKVSQEVSNLSKSLKTQSPDAQDRDRKQQIQQLQQKMLETQAQLARLTSQSAAKSVDVTLLAPRKR